MKINHNDVSHRASKACYSIYIVVLFILLLAHNYIKPDTFISGVILAIAVIFSVAWPVVWIDKYHHKISSWLENRYRARK
jgi:predicted neutral ceramidase superfamily lipid hydrolase